MASLPICPRCGRSNPNRNSYCAACGNNLSSSSNGNRWKTFFSLFALFVGLVWMAATYTHTQTPMALVAPLQPQSLVSSNTPIDSSPQSITLTSAQHLAEAKQALAEGYKPNKDPKKASWGEVSAAKWHLKAIGSNTAEYREAQVLLKEVTHREKQIEIATKQTEVSPPAYDNTVASIKDDDSNSTSSTAVTSPSPSSGTGRSSTSSDKAGQSPSDDHYTNVDGVRVKRPTFSDSGPPSGASARCRDGSYSFSLNRRGTCSHHGGVAKWL